MLIKALLAPLVAAALIIVAISTPASAMTGGQELPQPGAAPRLAGGGA